MGMGLMKNPELWCLRLLATPALQQVSSAAGFPPVSATSQETLQNYGLLCGIPAAFSIKYLITVFLNPFQDRFVALACSKYIYILMEVNILH